MYKCLPPPKIDSHMKSPLPKCRLVYNALWGAEEDWCLTEVYRGIPTSWHVYNASLVGSRRLILTEVYRGKGCAPPPYQNIGLCIMQMLWGAEINSHRSLYRGKGCPPPPPPYLVYNANVVGSRRLILTEVYRGKGCAPPPPPPYHKCPCV